MMRYSIAAIALVATSTFAMADPNNGGPAGGASSPGSAGGAAMERSGGGMGDSAPGGAMKGGDSSGASMKGDRGARSEDGSGKMGKNALDDGPGKADRQRASDNEGSAKPRNRQADDSDRNMKTNDRADRQDRQDRKSSDQARESSKSDRGATGVSEGTEGKSRPKGSLTGISAEQKTRVRSAFGSHRVAPARDIGVAVSVGVVVPRTVHFYPVPQAIIAIAPDYSGYEYFMIDEDHVAIVDPDTLEVVDIIVVA